MDHSTFCYYRLLLFIPGVSLATCFPKLQTFARAGPSACCTLTTLP